jgi:cobalamin biosynthesis Mg chelatase CobN
MDKVVDTIETVVEVESETPEVTQSTVQTTTTTTNTNRTSNNSTTKNNTKEITEEKVEENSTVDVSETGTTTKAKSKSTFYIDWVAIFSLMGSLLCIGMIVRLMNMIKKLEK